MRLLGLTLRGMDGMRRQARPSGRSVAGLSVFALLAFACFPVLALADSSGIEYENSIPKATGNSPIPTGKGKGSNGGPATASGAPAPGQSATRHGSSGAHSKGSHGQSQQGGAGSGVKGTAQHPAEAAVSAADVAGGSNATPASSSSGPSPFVAILIAVLALAAISIGMVLARQRRQRGGSVSPKAG
jgi:cobalamin biosynthesis Mg chelatase CobN